MEEAEEEEDMAKAFLEARDWGRGGGRFVSLSHSPCLFFFVCCFSFAPVSDGVIFLLWICLLESRYVLEICAEAKSWGCGVVRDGVLILKDASRGWVWFYEDREAH